MRARAAKALHFVIISLVWIGPEPGPGPGPGVAKATPLNVESSRPDPADGDAVGTLDVRFALRSGNVYGIDAGIGASVAMRRSDDLFMLLGAWKVSARAKHADGASLSSLRGRRARVANASHWHLRHVHRIVDWLESEVFTQYQSDEFVLLELRVLAGAGFRWTPWRSNRGQLALGTSYFAEFERLDRESHALIWPKPEQASSWAHRWSSYLSVSVQLGTLKVSSTSYVQPRFDEFRDLRIISDNQVEVRVASEVALVFGVSLAFDSMPPAYCLDFDPERARCPKDRRVDIQRLDVSADQSLRVRF